MSFPINAATNVQFTGDRFLHAWVAHSFSGSSDGQPRLVAKARQFSSFMLIAGKISGPDTFAPEHAIILQNKDELTIPLLVSTKSIIFGLKSIMFGLFRTQFGLL